MLDARRDAIVSQRILDDIMSSDAGVELWGRGRVLAKMLPAGSGALFVAYGLQGAPEGHTYQLWMMEGDCKPNISRRCRIWSGGLFDTREGMATTWYDGSMYVADRVAVTIESEGGAKQPGGELVCISE